MVVTAIVILAGLAVPNLVPARKAASESSAIANIRQIMSAQASYSATGNGEFGSLSDLVEADLIDENVVEGDVNGYHFEMETSGNTGFSVTATPTSGETVQRRFYGDETGVIRFTNDGSPPTAQSPGLGVSGSSVVLIPHEN